MPRAVVALLCLPPIVGAETRVRGSSTHHLRIHSQPLELALQEFAKQSGTQVVFFSRVAEGHQSRALDGRYTVASGLGELLSGTDLTFRAPEWEAALTVSNVFDKVHYETVGSYGTGNWYAAPRALLLRVDGRL
jgi:iron complex outermembrane recepter protein